MKIQLYLLILSLSFGCSGQTVKSNPAPANTIQDSMAQSNDSSSIVRKDEIQNLQALSIVEQTDTYATVKQKIEEERKQLAAHNLPVDALSKIFKAALLHKIIPFWEGTPWSFEGHTSKPQQGSIACGYFVSTTLRDIGLKLNRYKLAQQNPLNEAKTLALHTEVKEIAEASTADNILQLQKQLKAGIHFIGFEESHVGYILKEKEALYLIHSNYIGALGVVLEPISSSEVFRAYRKFYIVELSTNEQLLKHWVNGETVVVVQ